MTSARYISVCSEIEAAPCAWHGFGWEPLAFSEIEPFPRPLEPGCRVPEAVLAEIWQ